MARGRPRHGSAIQLLFIKAGVNIDHLCDDIAHFLRTSPFAMLGGLGLACPPSDAPLHPPFEASRARSCLIRSMRLCVTLELKSRHLLLDWALRLDLICVMSLYEVAVAAVVIVLQFASLNSCQVTEPP